MTERTFRLSSPNLPAVPSPRVKDPTLQRTHDAVREVIETMRGTRGNQLDRAVFIRDLVATGILSLNSQTGIIGPGPSVDPGTDSGTDSTIPPLLQNIVATAGFAYILLTWNDPNYKPLAFYEVYRLRVNNPNDSPGYTADDARITASELSEYNALLANTSRTPVQNVLMGSLGDLATKTTEYDYAKQYSLLYPNDQDLADAYLDASAALKTSRLGVATAQSNNVASAVHVGSTPSPVYSDAVDGGSTYLYWVRAVSISGIAGPFNAVGVTATTQPDISGVIDELTSEVNRGVVTDLIFNGLDNPDNGLSLLENLMDLEALAEQAAEDASSALSASVAGIPTVVWDSIHALYNRLASSAVGSALDQYEQTVDINTLGQRVATAETTIIQGQSDTAALSGRIDSYATQFDAQFAEVNTAISALSTADAAFATELTALEGAVYDPATGAQAAHGRIDDILDLAVSDDSALLTTLTQLEASVGEVQGQITNVLNLQIAPSSALAARLTELQLSLDTVSGTVNDLLSLSVAPDSLLAQRLTSFEAQFAATNALVQDVLELDIDQDSVLARALRGLEASVASATGSIADLSYLMVQADNVAALKVSRLEGAVDNAKGQIDDILDLRVSATSALATKLTSLEASVGDSAAKVRDILALEVDATSVLAGKLTELEAQTDYAAGAVSDMLSLRFTSDAVANSAYANSMQSFQLQLDTLESTVQSYTYNVLNDFTDAYGNLTDPVARAGWGVRVEQTVAGVPYISGLGLNQDIYLDSQGVPQAFSEFVVAADRFAIVDPSNPDTTKNSPFVVAPDPDDPTGAPRVWIRDAMISRAAIQSLTAGMVTADMVRAGAFIQTANLYTPTINVGTWELQSGADPTKPGSWLYNPASGRQGNFSVDSSGIMHATSAVLRSLQVRDYNDNIILDAGNGVYSSKMLTGASYDSYHGATWDFRNDLGPWGATNATLSVGADAAVITGTATANPYIRITHGGINVAGNIFTKVRVRYRRTVGTGAWDGQVYYTTAGHTGFVAGYRKAIDPPEPTIENNKWYISEWDMENLTAGGTDWTDNVITGLRVDLASGASEVWEVDWITIGRQGTGEWTSNTINPSNPLTSTNIGTYIAQLAVGTLHMGGNAVTVPNSATSSTTQTLLPGSWTDLLTVAFSVPTVGLSSVDNNIPIILSWAIEADIQNSAAAVRQWQVLKDGVAIYTSNSNLLDTEQFCSGVIKHSINAGATVTFKLQGKGNSGVSVYQKSMWVMAARR